MEPESHASHGHHAMTGHRWLDMSLALSAFIISLVSVGIAIHHGRTMDRLVASNSYPNIDVENGNVADLQDGRGPQPAVYLALVNTGIGPSRLKSLEVSYGGRAVGDWNALLGACCRLEAGVQVERSSHMYSGDVSGEMLPAGRRIMLFAWPRNDHDPRWALLEKKRGQIQVRVCYCSVFDECYVRESTKREPEPAESCPLPPVPYDDE